MISISTYIVQYNYHIPAIKRISAGCDVRWEKCSFFSGSCTESSDQYARNRGWVVDSLQVPVCILQKSVGWAGPAVSISLSSANVSLLTLNISSPTAGISLLTPNIS